MILAPITLAPITALLILAAIPDTATAGEAKGTITLKAGRLSDALRDLSIKGQVGLLFSPEVVGNRRSPRVSGALPVDGLLARLLNGTGLAFRRTAADTIIIYPAPVVETPAVPEILVTGHKTQNADIRRTDNDIQPYQVITSADVEDAHADNVDQLLRTRLAADAQLLSPSQDPAVQAGANRSEINLHGLGAAQTLVLVDGARMPGLPDLNSLTLDQPDINGIPLLAIDRVEVLTSTAGGIYGPGATGGVANIVLKRDYRGADIESTFGQTGRGDAQHWRIDARLGFTPDHGRTNVMVTFSQATADGLTFGQRGYAAQARALLYAQDPATFMTNTTTGSGVIVRSATGQTLSLTPALGGASLGSSYTYLPLGNGTTSSNLVSQLLANAGKYPTGLSSDGSGNQKSLMPHTRTTSFLFNIRHEFGDSIEAFIDALGYENDGRAITTSSVPYTIAAGAATNPFAQSVEVSFPWDGFNLHEHTNARTYRISGGIIVHLPLTWKAELNYSLGGSRLEEGISGNTIGVYGIIGLALGRPFVAGNPLLNPFGTIAALDAGLDQFAEPYSTTLVLHERFRDASVRLAGPLVDLPAGPLTLSILGERRREDELDTSIGETFNGQTYGVTQRGFGQTVTSGYGEFRVPLIRREQGPAPLRGLELQMAVRYDGYQSTVPTGSTAWLEASETAMAYTAGMKVYPQDHVMLRASISTGVVPPSPAELRPVINTYTSGLLTPDPERNGQLIGSQGPVTVSSAGSPGIQPEHARALSAGIVINADDVNRPRISLDYTRIEKSNEIIDDFGGLLAYFVRNEALYPGRVIRAPLTSADVAAGYTGGVITGIDASYLNVGKTWSDSIDLRVDYTQRLESGDRLKFYGTGTWQPRLDRLLSLDRPVFSYAGYADGPLRWRGNVGVDWIHDTLTLGANGQFYGPYYAIDFETNAEPTVITTGELQLPGVRIPSQFYLDLSLSYRVALPGALVRNLVIRFGIQDVLDHSPPIATNTDIGYSTYGDPRGRRFEMTIGAHF